MAQPNLLAAAIDGHKIRSALGFALCGEETERGEERTDLSGSGGGNWP